MFFITKGEKNKVDLHICINAQCEQRTKLQIDKIDL